MTTSVKSGSKVKVVELGKEPEIDKLKSTEREAGALKRHEVRVAIKAVSLNYRDLLVVKGHYAKLYDGATTPGGTPLIPCSDGAGEVVEIGEDVSRFKIGDRVAGIFMQGWIGGEINAEIGRTALGGSIDGVLRESVVFEQEGLVHLPEHLSYEEGSTLPCAAVTAWNGMIHAGKIKAGDIVLTLGTGGVSIFAVQFAKMMGARVIATSSSNEKLARLQKEFGVDKNDCINYKDHPDWDKQVLSLTGKRGVDHTVEVGGAGTLSKSVNSTKIGGQISVIGVLANGESDFNPINVLMKTIRLQGIYVGSREMFEDMNRAISLHRIKPVVDKVFKFEDAIKAFQYMESQAHFGKVVIKF